ncbi:MAG: DUF424 family protein [Candidatus Aenigmarchaeota archaeon]|nr:DUF424 family protein [Candidatus Aenigmarchaeota archaeon]
MHKADSSQVVSVCDSDIIGKRFEEKDIVLDIPESFYGGKEKAIDNVISAISASNSTIIIGNTITTELEKRGIISESHISSVAGQRYAMIFRL